MINSVYWFELVLYLELKTSKSYNHNCQCVMTPKLCTKRKITNHTLLVSRLVFQSSDGSSWSVLINIVSCSSFMNFREALLVLQVVWGMGRMFNFSKIGDSVSSPKGQRCIGISAGKTFVNITFKKLHGSDFGFVLSWMFQQDRDNFLNIALEGYERCLVIGDKYDVRVVWFYPCLSLIEMSICCFYMLRVSYFVTISGLSTCISLV